MERDFAVACKHSDIYEVIDSYFENNKVYLLQCLVCGEEYIVSETMDG